MKKLIMTLAAFSLFASGPAFAGCGSHGGGYSRAYTPSASRQYSTPAPRATVERKAVAAKAVKPTTSKVASAAEAEDLADAADAKLPKQAVAAVEAIAGTNALAPIGAEVARECKQYSATIGSLISVACE
jgi:hypothetical protein